jgi:hypothetical protein
VWATLLGWLIFSDLPSVSTIVGALVIIACGLYVYRQPAPVAGEIEPATTIAPASADHELPALTRRSIE